MESRTRPARPAAMLSALLLATTISMTGCAMFAKGEPARMPATVQSVKDDYTKAKLQTEIMEDDLDELSASPDADLKQAYGTFSRSADSIRKTGERLIVHADEMHFLGSSYLIEAEKTAIACVYPRLRRPEDKKDAELGSYFEAISDESWEIKRAFRALEFDLNQIQISLCGNLTPKSIDTISPMLVKAKVDIESLKYSLEQALAAIELAKSAKAEKTAKGS